MVERGRYIQKKFLIILFALSTTLLSGLSVGCVLYGIFLYRTMEQNIRYRLFAVSEMASRLVTLDELETYRTFEDMKLPAYKELRQKLVEFSRENNVLYVYYIRKSENGQLQYIVDGDFNKETMVGLDTPSYDIQTVPWIKLAFAGKQSYSGLGNYTPGWEGLLTTYTPLFDKDGNVAAVTGVDINDGPIVFARRMLIVFIALHIVVVIVVFVSGFITLFHYRVEAQKAFDANAAKSVFLSNMSHEFRTPINAVLGMGELIRMTNNLSLIQNYTDEITRAGQDLLYMVNDLIEYSNKENKSDENKPDK